MDRHAIQNAAERIDGYFHLRPHEYGRDKGGEAFDRAKEETLKNMRVALEQTEALTADDFFAARKHGSPYGNIADAIHYPECWDTAAYPTVLCALHEIYEWFKCSNDDCRNTV